MELVRLPQAARQLGVSYPTLKQWIYQRKIRSVKTPGGHHRIPRLEIDRLLFQGGSGGRQAVLAIDRHPKRPSARPDRTLDLESGTGLEHFISGRNQLVGRVMSVETVGLLSKVSLDIGGQRVTAIITRDACRDLGLKAGETAAALIKATEVMIIRPSGGGRS
jgi:molybdopterin-binding protein